MSEQAILPSPKIPRRSKLAGLLLALSSLGLTLVGLEGLTRFLPPPYAVETGQIFACHPALGWTGTPDFEGVFDNGYVRQPLKFNALGMHDTEHPLEKPAHTVRLLMLGDSFVQAVQVSEAATAHQLLEDKLNSDLANEPRTFEVISAGVVNWGSNQQLIYYRNQGRLFEPDLVVLMFYMGNDLLDNLPGNGLTIQGFNCYAPYFGLCPDGLNPQPLTYAPGISGRLNPCSSLRRGFIKAMGLLYQHSRLYQQLEPLITAYQPRQQFGLAYPSPFSALYLPTDEATLTEAWQLTQATLVQLQQEVEADQARLVVALISPEIILRLALLGPAERQVFEQDNPLFAQAQADRPNRRLADFLQGQNIPFIDLTGPMVERMAAQGEPLYLVGEGHWTAAGNRVAAEILAGWLSRQSIYQNPPAGGKAYNNH